MVIWIVYILIGLVLLGLGAEGLVRAFFTVIETTGRSPFDVCCDLASAIEPTPDDPLYHPFLYGAQQDGNARAGFG